MSTVPDDDPQVAPLSESRPSGEDPTVGACFLGWELWKHLELDRSLRKPWMTIRRRSLVARGCGAGDQSAVCTSSELAVRGATCVSSDGVG